MCCMRILWASRDRPRKRRQRRPLLCTPNLSFAPSYTLSLPFPPAHHRPKIEIPLHTVMKITYDGWNPPTMENFYLGPEPITLDESRPADDKDGQKNL